MLYDRPNDLVVLLLRCAEIRPREVLQLRHDATIDDLAVGVLARQLEPSLDEIGHERLNRDEKHLLITVKGYTLHRFILPDLTRPVLMALHLCVLLQMGQHHDQRNAFLVNHPPKILNCRLERPLGRYKELIVARDACIDKVRIDI